MTAPAADQQLDLFAEPLFECVIDESAGQADDREYQRKTQMTELPGSTFEDIFQGAAEEEVA